MPITDILIPTYHADFMWLEYLLKSVKKYTSGFRKIIIVSDNDGHIIPSSITNIVECTVLYIDVGPIPQTIRHRPGYFWQQYLKLNWMSYTDADAVLIFDSDEMATKPITPADLCNEEGKYHWFYRDWSTTGDALMWKIPTGEALLFTPPYEAMCVTGFVFDRETTTDLINYLKNKHNATSLLDVFFKYNASLFSEYNAYGSYILYAKSPKYYAIIDDNARDKYNYSILKSWSYGGLSAEDKKRREEVLNA
jgi:hypothetical protein